MMSSVLILLLAGPFSMAEENKKTVVLQKNKKVQAKSKKGLSSVLSKQNPAFVEPKPVQKTDSLGGQSSKSKSTSDHHSRKARTPQRTGPQRTGISSTEVRQKKKQSGSAHHAPQTRKPDLSVQSEGFVLGGPRVRNPSLKTKKQRESSSPQSKSPESTPTTRSTRVVPNKREIHSTEERPERRRTPGSSHLAPQTKIPKQKKKQGSSAHHAPQTRKPDLSVQSEGFVLGGPRVRNPSLKTKKQTGASSSATTNHTRSVDRNHRIGDGKTQEEQEATTIRRRKRDRNSLFQSTETSSGQPESRRRYRRSKERTRSAENIVSGSSNRVNREQAKEERKPQKQSCRESSYRIGLRGGLQAGGLNAGSDRSGSGGALGFRPCSGMLGLELSHLSYGESFNVDLDSPIQLSAQLYLSPDGFLSPFVSGGVSGAHHGASKDNLHASGIAFGPHFGLGLQSKLGPIAVNIEGRYLKYSNLDLKPQLQAIAGLDLHF